MGRIIAKKIRGMNWMAKVSLILIFTFVSSTFMYQGWYKPKSSEATRTTFGDGKVVYSATNATARTRNYTDATNVFDVEGNAGAAAAANPVVVKIVASPTRNEYIAGYVTTGGALYIKRWNGSAWVDDLGPITVGGTGINGRRFDLAYEQTSGDCILVYGNNAAVNATTGLVYRVWNGTSWAPAVNFGSARITGTATWIKMESRPSTDEIALIVSDSASDLTAKIWTGADPWGSEPTAALSATLEIIAAAGDADCFDLAYESLTGDLLIVWADAVGANGTNGVRYATRTAAGVWTLNQTPATFIDDATNLDLASDPGSDYILFGSIGNAGADYQHGAWNGTAWVNQVANADATALAPVAGSHTVACGWLKSGATTRGIIVYSDAAPAANGTVDFYSYTQGTGFTVGADFAYTASGIVTERQIEVSSDPLMPDRLLAVFSDNASDLWAKRLVMDGAGAFTWSNADAGTALTATLTNITAQAFSYAFARKDFTPPVAGTVTVSPDTGTYTSGSPTITTVFTDNESAVTSCEYTTNNGTNWYAGVVSGSSPSYTCTGSPTGLSGVLTINMRATSTGGTTTATAMSNRTVDAAGPIDGTLTVTPPDPTSLFLSWTAATDGGSGLRTTNTYDVRYLTGATPPTCSTGTSIYTGTGLSYTHTGLTTGQQYSYSVCAYDNVNNPSAGATGSGAPKWPATIALCSGCHGYTSSFADGTARNNPAGLFVGSHNKHVVTAGSVCSKCHAVPGGETSPYFGHRDSNITMASPINGDTSGAYGKGASWPQTNSPTVMQACSNVYCHSQGTSKTSHAGETRTTTLSLPFTTLNWGSAGACTSCHSYPPSYNNGDTTWGAAKANSHLKHTTQCSTCHNTTTSDSTSITGPANHANKLYTIAAGNGTSIGSYTYAAAGGSCNIIQCHTTSGVSDTTRQWGSGALPTTFKCITCHAVTQAITVGPLAGNNNRRDAVVNEFRLTWGHKSGANGTKTDRGAVTDADCIVCHLEGNFTTQLRSTYHGDGYIDLRDPDGGGEARITDMSAVSFRFAKFSTSYAAGSRTSTGNTSNNVDNVLTQKFCLGCHDSLGATNTTARSGAGNATMPFGGINLGADYTVANGAAAAGGLVNVKTEFSYTTLSAHPVTGPLNRDYPTAARVNDPYKPTGTRGTSGTLSNSVVMNCFDCHNVVGTALTSRTVAAHGNAVTIRGTSTVSNAPSSSNYATLCRVCHAGYEGSTQNLGHLAGSAFTSSNNATMELYMQYGCNICHGSGYAAAVVRPVRAMDVHGVNVLPTTGIVKADRWSTAGTPIAFIRNTADLSYHNPLKVGATTYAPGCGVPGGTTCNAQGNVTYTPGGTF